MNIHTANISKMEDTIKKLAEQLFTQIGEALIDEEINQGDRFKYEQLQTELYKFLHGKNAFNVKFPNGFEDWYETHFEVVEFIISILDHPDSIAYKAQAQGGHGALYELSESLTDEFENMNQGRQWDGDYYDELVIFFKNKNNK